MRRILAYVFVCAAVFVLRAPPLATATPLQQATQACVAIYDGDEPAGSGVVIGQEYVLTAAHVVADIDSWAANLVAPDGETIDFSVVKTDAARDVAVLHAPGLSASPISWGSSADLTAGQEIWIIGYPLGSPKPSVSKGIVSVPSQRLGSQDYVQTDAAINPGNSGGAVVDEDGRLVGIAARKFVGAAVSGMGFAIPADDARVFVSGYISGRASNGNTEGPTTPPPFPSASSSLSPTSSAATITTTSGGGGGGAGSGDAVLFLGAAGLGLAGLVGWALLASKAGAASAAAPGAPAVAAATPAAAAGPTLVAGGASFVVQDGGHRRSVQLVLPAIGGRASDCGLVIDDVEVSRHHFRLAEEAAGIVVTDLNSRNGLWVNGERVLQTLLAPGDSFRAGETTVTVVG